MRRVALALFALLSACGDGAPRAVGARRSVALPDGTVVQVPKRPERIVSTLPGITESVAFLDGGIERLVAVSPHCDMPPEVTHLPRVSVFPLSIEAIAARDPDLVLVDATLLRVHLPDLRRRFGAVLPMESRSLDGLAASLATLAAALGDEAAVRRWGEWSQDLVAARREAWHAVSGSSGRVLLVGQWEPFVVLGPGSLLHDMAEQCGAENVAGDLDRASAPWPAELVRARAPAWILSTSGQPMPGSLAKAWADVPAVRDGHVADASANDIVRAGPRTPQALRRLAKVFRGEIPPARLSSVE